MMSVYILCVFVFVSTLFVIVSCQNVPNPPCPSVFRYVNNGNGYYGVFKITPPYKSTLKVSVKMDIAGITRTPDNGKIDLQDGSNTVMSNMKSGRDILYRLTFPTAPNLPVIKSIVFNGKQICSGPPIRTLPRLMAQISHTFTTNIPNPYTGPNNNLVPQDDNSEETDEQDSEEFFPVINRPIYMPNNFPFIRPPSNFGQFGNNIPSINQMFPWMQGNSYNTEEAQWTASSTTTTTTTPRPRVITETPQRPVSNNQIGVCGVPRKRANELILLGDNTRKGEWPWLAALFLNDLGSLSFTCGGTLLSNDVVLTAGHCLIQRNYNPISKEKLLVMLGVFNIQDHTTEDTKRSLVDQVIFHPNFESGVKLRNDIAILKLKTKQEFSDYVIPACLWTRDLNTLSIIGNFGIIVGWGRDENGLSVSPEIRLTRQRVVSTDQCRDDSPEFRELTSDTTICAGNKNGTGPCNGDSGGGMFFSVSRRYVLRGIVSTSLNRAEAPNRCNARDYVVYTDVSKYIPWIYENM